jgi:starch phosphorylase
MFNDRDQSGLPRDWLARVKSSLTSIGPRFCATRMMEDYLRHSYGLVAGSRER